MILSSFGFRRTVDFVLYFCSQIAIFFLRNPLFHFKPSGIYFKGFLFPHEIGDTTLQKIGNVMKIMILAVQTVTVMDKMIQNN